MKLGFLIAGVQKGATTALHHYLCCHPDLYLPPKKELHFFDDEKIDWSTPPYDEAYHSHFSDAPTGALWGEATPIYTYWPPSLDRIYQYNRRIKLIVLLRDPVARAYSHWRMEFVRGAEKLSFSQAVRQGRQRITNNSEIPGHHRVYSYLERGFYAEQVRNILSKFPRDQVLFLNSNDLLLRHEKTLNQICDFLGVAGFGDTPEHQLIFSHKNMDTEVPGPTLRDIEYLRAFFYDNLKQTQELIGHKIEPEFT